MVNHIFEVGEVVCGVLCEGELRMRERVVIGPSREGVWREATIGSIRRSKVSLYFLVLMIKAAESDFI